MDRKTKNCWALYLVFVSTLIIWLLKNVCSSSPNPTVDKTVKVICKPPKEKSSSIYNTISIAVSIIALLISVAALRANYAEVQQMQAEVNEMALYNRLAGIPRVEFAIIRSPSEALPSYPIPGVYMVNYGPGLAILDRYRISFNNENITEEWDSKDWETVEGILGISVLPNPRFVSPSKYLPPDNEYPILWVGFETDEWNQEYKAEFDQIIDQLSFRISYHSVYNEEEYEKISNDLYQVTWP